MSKKDDSFCCRWHELHLFPTPCLLTKAKSLSATLREGILPAERGTEATILLADVKGGGGEGAILTTAKKRGLFNSFFFHGTERTPSPC
jgi:hypothetical protein